MKKVHEAGGSYLFDRPKFLGREHAEQRGRAGDHHVPRWPLPLPQGRPIGLPMKTYITVHGLLVSP